jgi:stage V sporulation protein AA
VENKQLYIKVEQCNIVHKKEILIKDVAKLYSSDSHLVKDVGEICIFRVNETENQMISFSIMKIIDLIGRQIKNLDIINLGEKDFIVSYEISKEPNLIWEYTKAAIVALIIFFGSAFTIMTFNEDVNVGSVFGMIYDLFWAKEYQKYYFIEVSYSFGLFIGILIFFNHFSKKKSDLDPTPLQIELRNYEKQINSAIISGASREGKKKDV